MTRKLRIAFVGNFRAASVNGVENSGFSLAVGLSKLGHEVFFYYLGKKEEQFVDAFHINHRSFKKQFLSLWLSNGYRQAIVKNQDNIDVFHLHSVFIPEYFTLVWFLNRFSRPYVVTPHGGYLRQSIKETLRKHHIFAWLYFHIIERYVIRHARGLVAITQQEAKQFVSLPYSGPVYVIPNPLPFCNSAKSVMQASEVTVLYLGRYDAVPKGLFFLLDTFQILSRLHPKVQLKMYGSGKDKSRLMAYVNKKSIPRVQISDAIFGQDKAEALEQCALYFQPSKFEVFGISIVEAMMAGKPVVLTSGCHLSEWLRMNNLGCMVADDPRQAAETIYNFLTDRTEMARHGSQLKALASYEFNQHKVACQFWDMYCDVVNKYDSVSIEWNIG